MKHITFSRFSIFGRIVTGLFSMLFLLNENVSGQGLPSAPKRMIETSIANWNNYYGSNVKALKWTYEGVIRTEKERQAVIVEITNTSKAWMPQLDVTMPAFANADRIASFPTIPANDITAWKNKTAALLKIGQHRVRVNWMKGTTPFTTLCITDDATIIYDNIFSNCAMVDHHSKCFDYHMWWVWEDADKGTRGKIWANLDVKCDAEGKVIECVKDCGGDMTLGQAECICISRIVGNCCVMDYSWAWACGFKSLKFTFDAKGVKVGVEVEGWLGSSGKGNGTCIECCPVKSVAMNPVSTPRTTGTAGIDGPQKVRTISVKTLSGEVIDIKVPNIIRPGDQITGSVDTKTLQGAVVDVENKQTNVKDKIFKFIVPAGLASIPFLLKNAAGEILGTAEIPVNTPNIPTPAGNITVPAQQIQVPPPHAPGSFAPMNYCQPGEPLTINGFFDGNASNTNVSINNIPCEIITESNTGSFAQIPDNIPSGKASLTIEEGGVTQTMPIQVITTSLTTNKKTLRKDAKAEINVTISGLENLKLADNNFTMQLTNQSPANIAIKSETGNTITRNITESDVKGGVYSFSTIVTGISTGPFTLNLNVNSSTCTECWKQYERCINKVAADEERCYKNCDKGNGGTACYLACSVAARAQETECFAQYLGCVRAKLGF